MGNITSVPIKEIKNNGFKIARLIDCIACKKEASERRARPGITEQEYA